MTGDQIRNGMSRVADRLGEIARALNNVAEAGTRCALAVQKMTEALPKEETTQTWTLERKS